MTDRVDVSVAQLIHAPREKLASFAADPSNAPKWYVNIKSVKWVSEPGTRVGAQAAFVAEFFGRRLAYTYEITDYSPDERLVMQTAQGPFPMATIYAWRDAPGGTEMTMTNRGNPAGFKSVLAPVMAAAMRRAMTRDLAALARLMES